MTFTLTLKRSEVSGHAGAIHIALTQARCYPPARELLERRTNSGNGGMEALRILKRRLSDVVYRRMIRDLAAASHPAQPLPAA